MSSKLFDQANILVQHIELVLAKLESVRMYVFGESTLSNALKSKDGQKIVQIATECLKTRNTKPDLSKSNKKFMSDNADKILSVIQSVDYIMTWCHAARTILFKMTEESIEFDIRWNNLFTLLICKLFVAYSKTVVFIYMFPTIKLAVVSACLLPNFDSKTLSNPIEKIRDFVGRASKDPFSFLIRSKSVSEEYNLSRRLSQLISQIGPIIIQVFGQWPLLNWDKFNVFTPKKATDSSYPDLEHLCLWNLSLLKDTILFFVLTFQDFCQENKRFKSITIAVCSESQSIYLTRQYAISFKELITAYNSQNAFPNEMKNLIAQAMKVKISLTHNKRIIVLTRLIKDINSIAGYNPNYIPKFVPDLFSLASFAIYEIDCALSENILHDEVVNLISIVVNSARLFLKHKDLIKRTFMYNMTIVDTEYLNQMLNNYSVAGVEWQYHFINVCSDISNDLSSIDIEEYDRGCIYDFTALEVTIGRTIMYFNHLKTEHSAAHLQNVVEHLNTIRLHAKLAQNPIAAFIEYCPIHSLWRHINTIQEISSEQTVRADGVGSIITLFSLFNLDAIAISQSQGEIMRMKQVLESIRASILKRIYSQLNIYIGKGSRIQEISKQNRFNHIFDPNSIIAQIAGKRIDYEKETQFKDPIWQLRSLMLNMPGSFEFAGKTIRCAGYIGEAITNCLATILFNEPIPDPLWVDSSFSAAAQFIWPLFTLIGAPFPLKLLQCKYQHSADESVQTFLQQVSVIKTTYVQKAMSPEDILKNKGVTQLIKIFQDFTVDFLNKEYTHYAYYPHSRSFEYIQVEKSAANISPFFSYTSLKSLIKNLGLYAGFAIDRILINHASSVMIKIFKIQKDLMSELNPMYTDFIKGGSMWKKAITNPKLEESADLMINLGITLKIRQILRDAIKDTVDVLIPGLTDIINAALKRVTGELPEKENIIIEIVSGAPQFHFLLGALQRENILAGTDSIIIYFFFALLLSIPKFQNIKYNSENEFISYNLHLFPVGVDGFLNCLSVFTTASDIRSINEGMNLFFNMMSSILQSMRNNQTVTLSSQYAFTIIVDLFPRSLRFLEYGRIGKNFPPSVISEAYRAAASQNFHELASKKSSKKKKK